jgi:hypothetical protein
MDRYGIALNKPAPPLKDASILPIGPGPAFGEFKGIPACNYECVKRDNHCGATSQDGFGCTRDPGHEGPHVACGVQGNHVIDIWANE